MASITASGHREIARWKRDSDGAEIILTGKPGSSFRVLRKTFKGEGWNLSHRLPKGMTALRINELETYIDDMFRGFRRV